MNKTEKGWTKKDQLDWDKEELRRLKRDFTKIEKHFRRRDIKWRLKFWVAVFLSASEVSDSLKKTKGEEVGKALMKKVKRFRIEIDIRSMEGIKEKVRLDPILYKIDDLIKEIDKYLYLYVKQDE